MSPRRSSSSSAWWNRPVPDPLRARCSSCGRWPTVTASGRLRAHRDTYGRPCPGHQLTTGQLDLTGWKIPPAELEPDSRP